MANEKRLLDANAFRRRIEAFVATARYKGINNVPTGYESCNPTEYMRGYERGVMDAYTVAVEQPQVDAVEVPDKKLLKAINLLIKQYEHSKNSDYVHSPVAHAFFHTWKQLDGRRE